MAFSVVVKVVKRNEAIGAAVLDFHLGQKSLKDLGESWFLSRVLD